MEFTKKKGGLVGPWMVICTTAEEEKTPKIPLKTKKKNPSVCVCVDAVEDAAVGFMQ